MNIYENINREIFTEPFYNICKTDDRRLLAWYFLNCKNFSQEEVQELLLEQKGQHFIDGIYFDEKNFQVFVANASFKGINEKIDFISINSYLNFFSYMLNLNDFSLTNNAELDRKCYYLQDCYKRGYKINFEFITTCNFTDDCKINLNKIQNRLKEKSATKVSITLIDNGLLLNRYLNADNYKRERVQTATKLEICSSKDLLFFQNSLFVENKRAFFEIVNYFKDKYKVSISQIKERYEILRENLDKEGVLENFIYLHIYTFLECFSVISGIKDNSLAQPSCVYMRLRKHIYQDNLFSSSLEWLVNCILKEIDKLKLQAKDFIFNNWIKTKNCFYSIRSNIRDYFCMYENMSLSSREVLSVYKRLLFFCKEEFTTKFNSEFFLTEKEKEEKSFKEKFSLRRFLLSDEYTQEELDSSRILFSNIEALYSSENLEKKELKNYFNNIRLPVLCCHFLAILSFYNFFTDSNFFKKDDTVYAEKNSFFSFFKKQQKKIINLMKKEEAIKFISVCSLYNLLKNNFLLKDAHDIIISSIENLCSKKVKDFNEDYLALEIYAQKEEFFYDLEYQIKERIEYLSLMPGPDVIIREFNKIFNKKVESKIYTLNKEGFN